MDLIRNNIVSDSLRFLAAKAGYESIKQLTEYLLITAPFDGIVTDRSLSPGALVGPGGNNDVPILKLKSETKLRLHIAVPERNLGELTIGKNVKFKVKSFPEKTFHGKISRRGKSVDRQTRSEIVEIVVDNPSGQLLPGMFAHATIPLQRPGTSFVVPSESIVTNMERSFVVKMAKGKATWVDIEQGENQGDLVEIFGDLHEGDTLLHTASDEIRNGTNLKTILVDL
jgi:RND family efflux transporter MFP subunit